MSNKQIVEQALLKVPYPRYISNQPKGEDLFKGKVTVEARLSYCNA